MINQTIDFIIYIIYIINIIAITMQQCPKHNLPQQIVCLGQMCNKRIGCQLCIDKHQHKFYLDTKSNQKNVNKVKQQIFDKIVHLQKYTKANITNLMLINYKDKIQKSFENQLIYFDNKIAQELLNINIWIEKITKIVKTSLEQSKNKMLENWQKYYNNSQKHMQQIEEYKKLQKYFRQANWGSAEHIQKTVAFLYSQQLFFKFNRNLDALKTVINLHKKQDGDQLFWFQQRRNDFLKLQICPHKQFEQIAKKYQNKPILSNYEQPKAKIGKDDRTAIMDMIKQDSKAVLLYPQTIYEPFQNVYKLIRYDNSIFVTSGGRSVNLWTRVSSVPQKSYPLNFPSYGVLSFVEYGKDEAQQIVYGKSNGELGLINMKKDLQSEMPAHQSAIRDIIQYDSYHFLTASQDWKLKLWAMSSEKQKQTKKHFASERLTLTGHSGRIYTICKFGPSVLAAGCDGTIKLWDIMRQSFDEVFTQQKQIYTLAQIRPQLFASGGQIKQVRVWDYRKTKAHVCKFAIQNTCNTILRYDDNTLIINDKNIIKVIDIRNTKQVVERMCNDKTYTHVVNSMAYLSDNQIGMGGNDNIISIWKY